MLMVVAKTGRTHARKRWFVIQKKYLFDTKACPRKGAIILSGSGYLDGTSIYEAVATAIFIEKFNLKPVFYAPKRFQGDVINHLKKQPKKECRAVLEEAARIARGSIRPLKDLHYYDVSLVVFPGGFGVAKTLSTFDRDREKCLIDDEVTRVLEEFHDCKKPMGFICIAAVLPARLFPLVKVTLGMKGSPKKWPYQYAIDCATAMGADVQPREVNEFSFDKQRMIFSTPAFMYNGTFNEIFNGIGIMIQNMCKYIE